MCLQSTAIWVSKCSGHTFIKKSFISFQAKLCKKYRVQGIPKLVLVDGENGQTITRDGYSHLMEDEKGAEFPWRQEKFLDIIKGKLIKEGNEVDAVEELKGKTVGLYFSAHWVSVNGNKKFMACLLIIMFSFLCHLRVEGIKHCTRL